MFNLSRFIKRAGEEKAKAVPPRLPPISFSHVEESLNIAHAIKKTDQPEDREQARRLYDDMVAAAKECYSSDAIRGSEFIGLLGELVARVADFSTRGILGMTEHILQAYPAGEERNLSFHAANVTILSLELGAHMRYDKARLIELGIAAFLHDVGLLDAGDLLRKPERFNKDDRKQVQEHPTRGASIAERFGAAVTPEIVEAIRQEHERLDGTGYPSRLKSNTIAPYARIIAVADIYEAITHARPYRAARSPVDAIKSVLDEKKGLDRDVLKALIERIGIYPAGTLVELNTGEIAVVCRNDFKAPFRPIIDVIADAERKEIAPPRRIALSTTPVVYIRGCAKK